MLTALEPASSPTPLSRPASSMLRMSRRSWLHLTGKTPRKAPEYSYRRVAVAKQPCVESRHENVSCITYVRWRYDVC